MEKKKKQWKSTKIWKWTISSLFLILFGGSLIVNITYLPKYFALKNRSDNALKIDVTAYDDTKESPSSKLFVFHYQTTMATLGDLLAQYPENYSLQNGGAYGRSLSIVKYYDDENNEHILNGDPTSKGPYWIIYINNEYAPTGIDGLYLSMNEQIQLHYENPQ